MVKRRDRIAKKKLVTNKSGLFIPKKYTRMTEPITKNIPFTTQALKTHGHSLAR